MLAGIWVQRINFIVDLAVAMADPVEELFGYNRENFMFDQELRQWREYQEQDMRVKQFMLYREDVRDLTELTISKMDSYLMVAVLELGCCLDLLVHGVLHIHEVSDEPTWNLWLYVISLAEAFVFLFLSAWLAIHASVSSHSFSVRLLTQFVRLPLPNKQQIDAASAAGTDYENMGVEDMLRIPILRQQAERVNTNANSAVHTAGDPSGTAVAGLVMSQPGAVPATALKHVQVYRDLQDNWQAHDAYARACLALGTYKLLHALAYYTVGLLVLEMHAPWAGLAASMVLPMLSWLLIRLDLYFASTVRMLGALALMLGPLLALVAATLTRLNVMWVTRFCLVAVIFAMHALLIVCVAHVARAEHVSERGAALPTRFRSVLYLDVFGWVQAPDDQPAEESRVSTESRREMPNNLREGLYKECSRLGRQLRLEFSTWDLADLENLPNMLKHLRALQREFESICRDFRDAHDTDLSRLRISTAADTSWTAAEFDQRETRESPEIFLRLEWQCERVSVFVQPQTGARGMEEPQGKFISDLNGLAARMEMLRQRIEALKEDARAKPRSRISRFAGGLMPQTHAHSQETRYGGRESSDISDLGGTDFLMASETAAQTFFPRRDRREESKQLPGQVPWHTVFIASSVLVTVWVVGIVWYVLYPIATHKSSAPETPTLAGALLFEWPARTLPLRPVAMACDENYSHVIIAERFAVHEVSVDAASTSATLSQCLAQQPSFRAQGLTAAGVRCWDSACRAAFRNTPGSILICPLGTSTCPAILLDVPLDAKVSNPCHIAPGQLESMLDGDKPPLPRERFLDTKPLQLSEALLGDVSLSLTGSSLHAWAEQVHLASWSLPQSHEWTACHAAGEIFALGTQEFQLPELWSFPVPL